MAGDDTRWEISPDFPDGHAVPLTPDEIAERDARRAAGAVDAAREQTATTNTTTLRDRARQALDVNTAFLALAPPSQAQTLAQVKALTRETTAVIRLLLNAVDTTDGT